jgi:O-antigen/teichoic acid export membrane protein
MHYGLKHNFLWVLINKGWVLITGVLAAAIINRAIGPEGRGTLAEIQTWMTLFAVVAGMSLDTAIYHCANSARYPANNSDKLATTLVLSAGCGIAGGIALLLFVFFWPNQVSDSARAYVFIMWALLFLTTLFSNATVFAQAMGFSKVAASSGVFQGALYLLLSAAGYFADSLSIKFVLEVGCIAQFTGLWIVLYSLWRHMGRGAEYRFHTQTAKAMIRAGAMQHLATISTFAYTKVNQLILFRYAGEAEAGLYAAALNLALVSQVIFGSFQTALYTRIIHANDEYETSIRAMRVVIYGGAVIVVVMLVFAKPLLLLYGGAEFSGSNDLFRLLTIAFWILSINSLAGPICVKAGAFRFSSASAVLLGIGSVALNFVLVPRMGALGAAVSTLLIILIGFLVILGYLWFYSHKNPFVVFKPDLKRELAAIRAVIKSRA